MKGQINRKYCVLNSSGPSNSKREARARLVHEPLHPGGHFISVVLMVLSHENSYCPWPYQLGNHVYEQVQLHDHLCLGDGPIWTSHDFHDFLVQKNIKKTHPVWSYGCQRTKEETYLFTNVRDPLPFQRFVWRRWKKWTSTIKEKKQTSKIFQVP